MKDSIEIDDISLCQQGFTITSSLSTESITRNCIMKIVARINTNYALIPSRIWMNNNVISMTVVVSVYKMKISTDLT